MQWGNQLRLTRSPNAQPSLGSPGTEKLASQPGRAATRQSHTRRQLCKRCVASVRQKSCRSSLLRILWREGGDDFLEARIAAERIPDREQFQGAVAQHHRCDGSTQPSFHLLQGKVLVARPRCRKGEILKDAPAVEDGFFHR